jgi:urocanate hydratase
MTAGSYCYIGPQGIVHGTTLVLLNAGRKYLGIGKYTGAGEAGSAASAETISTAGAAPHAAETMAGRVYVSSGLGGMSGAQGKAGRIAGLISLIAEVDRAPLEKRHAQGWCGLAKNMLGLSEPPIISFSGPLNHECNHVMNISCTLQRMSCHCRIDEIIDDLPACMARLKLARAGKEVVALGFHGNIVALWEALAAEPELLVEMGSDQTSCHNPFNGGYYPCQLSFADAQRVMAADPPEFKRLVQESLRRQVTAINTLCAKGMRFWDYGNSFMLEAGRASADIFADAAAAAGAFRYPTYIQEFMGDIFSLGFGPFRWVCTSGDARDLRHTDHLAADVIRRLRAGSLGGCGGHGASSEVTSGSASVSAPASGSALIPAPARVDEQLADNLLWIEQAESHRMVVGSQARILYADAAGRVEIAVAINRAIRDGHVSVRARCLLCVDLSFQWNRNAVYLFSMHLVARLRTVFLLLPLLFACHRVAVFPASHMHLAFSVPRRRRWCCRATTTTCRAPIRRTARRAM